MGNYLYSNYVQFSSVVTGNDGNCSLACHSDSLWQQQTQLACTAAKQLFPCTLRCFAATVAVDSLWGLDAAFMLLQHPSHTSNMARVCLTSTQLKRLKSKM